MESRFDEEHNLWEVRFVHSQGSEHVINWDLASSAEFRQLMSKFKQIETNLEPPFVIETVVKASAASSNGNAYYYSPQGLCRRFIVGVGTPTSGQFTITIAPSVQPTNKNLCNELSGDVAIYTKSLFSSSFSLSKSAHLKGSWVSGSGFGVTSSIGRG